MSGKKYTTDLPRPDAVSLALSQLLCVLDTPLHRDLVGRLLADEREEQGLLEHPGDAFASTSSSDIAQGLQRLRHAGWVDQRPSPHGLLTRLRRHDLDDSFPGLLDHLTPRIAVDYLESRARDGHQRRRRLDGELRRLLHPH